MLILLNLRVILVRLGVHLRMIVLMRLIAPRRDCEQKVEVLGNVLGVFRFQVEEMSHSRGNYFVQICGLKIGGYLGRQSQGSRFFSCL